MAHVGHGSRPGCSSGSSFSLCSSGCFSSASGSACEVSCAQLRPTRRGFRRRHAAKASHRRQGPPFNPLGALLAGVTPPRRRSAQHNDLPLRVRGSGAAAHYIWLKRRRPTVPPGRVQAPEWQRAVGAFSVWPLSPARRRPRRGTHKRLGLLGESHRPRHSWPTPSTISRFSSCAPTLQGPNLRDGTLVGRLLPFLRRSIQRLRYGFVACVLPSFTLCLPVKIFLLIARQLFLSWFPLCRESAIPRET